MMMSFGVLSYSIFLTVAALLVGEPPPTWAIIWSGILYAIGLAIGEAIVNRKDHPHD